MIQRLVLASANPDKAAEMIAILGAVLPGLEIRPRPPELGPVVEDGQTLLDNARLKAMAVAVTTGEPALADDTGLEVEALDGAPGVFSARFAGEQATYADNVARLLRELHGVSNRRAVFRTVALLHWPDGHEVAVEGRLRGSIATTVRGEQGFGYDPVFVPDEGDGRTLAEMGSGAKNAISHRRRALQSLAAALMAPPARRVTSP